MRPRHISTLFPLLALAAGACATDAPTTPSARSISPAAEKSDGPAEWTFVSFDVDGSAGTLALDINSGGTIVGRYDKPTTLATGAFVRTPDGTITTFDYPVSGTPRLTVAAGINSRGDIVGQYTPPDAPRRRHGYLLSDGVFTSFDPPGSTFTNALGINDQGDIAGRFALSLKGPPGRGGFTGFLRHNGEFTALTFPGSRETDAFKINNRRSIYGGFVSSAGEEHVFRLRDGTYTEIALPISNPVSLDNGGQNARGDVVGVYCDGAPPCLLGPTGAHGFLLRANGKFETIDYPGAVSTSAIGINARGDIVGGWVDAARHFHGYLLTRQHNGDD